MSLVNASVLPKGPSSTVKLAWNKKLEKLLVFGYRVMFFGLRAEQLNYFIAKVFLYIGPFIFLTLIGIYEFIEGTLFARSLLEGAGHCYVAINLFAFTHQWYFLLVHCDKHKSEDVNLEEFNSTKNHPDVAEEIIEKRLRSLIKILTSCATWWVIATLFFLVPPLIEQIQSLLSPGQIVISYILPSVFEPPWWALILINISHIICIVSLLFLCVGSFSVMGSRVLKIKIQCEIINEALIRDFGETSNINAYIDDHKKILRYAEAVTGQLSSLNSIMFLALYFELALQMFSLSLIEPDELFFIAMAGDLMGIYIILAFQCALGSTITHSLESIAEGASFSPWYGRGKNHARSVTFMIQRAQKPYRQKILFGSIIVERATTISLLKSSYAVYTLLMIMQRKD